MSDEQADIGNLIETAYEALAFEPGSAPRWDLFYKVFHESAILGVRVFPADAEISILDLPRYTQAQLANGIKENGYSETVGKRNIRILGDVAVAEQYFTMNFPSGVQNAAIDFFSLVRTQGRWRIVSVVSDNVGQGEN